MKLSNTELEITVLSSAIINNELIPELEDAFSSKNVFSAELNRMVWDACILLNKEGKPADTITIGEYLNKYYFKNDGNAGVQYVVSLITGDEVNITTNVVSYAPILFDLYIRRDTVEKCNSILLQTHNIEKSAENTAEEAKKLFSDILIVAKDTVSLADSRETYLQQLQNVGKQCIKSGIQPIDFILNNNSFLKKQFVVIAGRPGTGKSTISLNIMSNMAKNGHKCLFISLEMSDKQVTDILMSSTNNILLDNLKSKDWIDSNSKFLLEKVSELSNLPIYLNFPSSSDISGIVREIKRVHSKHGIDVVFIDYIQLLSDRTQKVRLQEVSNITRTLKLLAMELDILVIGASQFNRDADGNKPKLSDLRESGTIEQDADIALLMYPDPLGASNPTYKDAILVDIAKHRNGATGETRILFNKPIGKSSVFPTTIQME